jgi:hypothetical protein
VVISPHVYGPNISQALPSQTEKYKGAAYIEKLSSSFGYLTKQVGRECCVQGATATLLQIPRKRAVAECPWQGLAQRA